MAEPRLVVLSTLFPHSGQPNAGLFVRERMFRVGRRFPLVVVSPQPWFPLQGLIRRFRPGYRPPAPHHEEQNGFQVVFPRFLALPGFLRHLDGISMALSCLPTLLRLRKTFGANLIDAHFAYPSGYAAALLGRWLKLPVTITLRGTEPGHVRQPALRRRVVAALAWATRVFAVSDSLKQLVVGLGIPDTKVRVVGNGVDLARFSPIARNEARRSLSLPADARILISVGGLVERKGFHRVIDCLPAIAERFPDIIYLVVGGGSPEGDMSAELKQQVRHLGLADRVVFAGPVAPQDLSRWLSAADVFVLSTRNEGWANVFLEAMACGLPVVTTDVGGNPEVICRQELGTIVPFGNGPALRQAVEQAIEKTWDRGAIITYARENSWDQRIEVLASEFIQLVANAGSNK